MTLTGFEHLDPNKMPSFYGGPQTETFTARRAVRGLSQAVRTVVSLPMPVQQLTRRGDHFVPDGEALQPGVETHVDTPEEQ